MTTTSHARRMSAKDYLYEKGRDFLERAYQIHAGGSYNSESDKIVAQELGPIAKMDGAETRLTADTLCKARSRFGLVRRASPRPAKMAVPSEEHAPEQLPLPPKGEHHGDPLWALVGQFKILNGHVADLKGILASAVGRGVLAQGKATATETKPTSSLDLQHLALTAILEFPDSEVSAIKRLRELSPGLFLKEARDLIVEARPRPVAVGVAS